MKIIDIIEARSKPGMNPKVAAYEQLLKYKDDPTIFISFTAVNKAGLNPRSTYNTPNGIYTYPLAKTWQMYNVDKTKDFSGYPFANTNPYIQILKATRPGEILDVDQYTDNQLRSDLKKVLHMFPDRKDSIMYSMDAAAVKSPAGMLWAITREASADTPTSTSGEDEEDIFINVGDDDEDDEEEYSTFNLGDYAHKKVGVASANRWSTLLRKLGYGLVIDMGHSVIHNAEPCQAVFFGRHYFKHLGVALNTRTQESTKKVKDFSMRNLHTIFSSGDERIRKQVSDYLIRHMPAQKLFHICANVLNRNRWPEAEPIIMKDPKSAIGYAEFILGKHHRFTPPRWEDAEPYIMKDPDVALQYANHFIRDRWPDAEPYIIKTNNLSSLITYIKDKMKARWPKAEPHMIQLLESIKDPSAQRYELIALLSYASKFAINDWNELKHIGLKILRRDLVIWPHSSLPSYMIEYAAATSTRWPELEQALKHYGLSDAWNTYVQYFPDAQPTYRRTQPTNNTQ